MTVPEYAEELHKRLTYLLDVVDPVHIANDDPNEYYHIAGYALCADTTLDIISAINTSLAFSIDESYVLSKLGGEFIVEHLFGSGLNSVMLSEVIAERDYAYMQIETHVID